MKYIGFDLDGTLAIHEEGADIDTIGAPIPAMVELARRFLADGIPVRIITARVALEYSDREAQRAMIQAWCLEHLGQAVPVQSHKCGRMERLYDDRAYGVQRNTGVLSTDYSQALGVVIGESNIKSYDRRYGLEGDAYADFEPELTYEPGCEDTPIAIYPTPGPDCFHIDSREARCLAASLIRAADEFDTAKQSRGAKP
jgi:hypothetical protein